jgi:carboxylesterase type B
MRQQRSGRLLKNDYRALRPAGGYVPRGEKTVSPSCSLPENYCIPSLAWAKIRTEDLNIPTWQYVFARRQEPMGAMHGAEIPYAFRTLYNNPNPMFKYTEQDTRLMDIITVTGLTS